MNLRTSESLGSLGDGSSPDTHWELQDMDEEVEEALDSLQFRGLGERVFAINLTHVAQDDIPKSKAFFVSLVLCKS